MRSEFNPEANQLSSPFFIDKLSFSYKVLYGNSRKRSGQITYTSPHEIILNLAAFNDNDKIIYVSNSTGQESFTLTIDRFKVMMSESVYNASQDDLESLYLRLLETNSYSKAIIDKGRLRHYDSLLSKYLLTIRGGYDCYLSYENRKVVLYFKYRRLSALHLLAVIQDWNLKNDVQINHINLPSSLSNVNLLYQRLIAGVDKNLLRLYEYEPVTEDNICATKIDREIIQIINQLIK